jgi:hypothetical protein
MTSTSTITKEKESRERGGRAGAYFLLNGELHLDPLGVGLGPDEAGINQPDLGETLEPLEAEGEELLGLEVAHHPLAWRLEVPLAELAPVNGGLLGNALGDIHLVLDAVHAHVGRVGGDGDSTLAAQTGMERKEKEEKKKKRKKRKEKKEKKRKEKKKQE